jgi:hypothetical protein
MFHLAPDFLGILALHESMLNIFFPSTENASITHRDMTVLKLSARRKAILRKLQICIFIFPGALIFHIGFQDLPSSAMVEAIPLLGALQEANNLEDQAKL